MSSTVRVPDFLFSGFYYPEIYQALLAFNRINATELTSEASVEPHIQMLRSFSLVGHLNNTRVDVVANEMLVDSLTLRESMQRLFELIDYKLKSATPATAELVIKFSTIPEVDIAEFIPAYTNWGTETEDGNEIIYENLEALSLNKGTQVDYAYLRDVTNTGNTDGSVNTGFPGRFISASAPFVSGDVGKTLVVSGSENGNGGEFVITNYVDAQTIEVADSSFITENSLEFYIVEYIDVSSYINDETNKFGLFPTAHSGGAFYLGHSNIQFDQIDFVVDETISPNIDLIWEYYDPTYSRAYPNSVTDNGGDITLVINSLLASGYSGIIPSRAGAMVKVTYNPTGKSELAFSEYFGSGNEITTRGLLGQSTVDTDPLNYTVECDWVPLDNLVDGTSHLSASGSITFELPMTESRRWTKATLEGNEGYFIRCRPVHLSGSTTPEVYTGAIDEGTQYFPFTVTQGETIVNEIIGSSNGQANQEFTTLRGPVFDDSYSIEVDETGGQSWVGWTPVDNFISSGETDRHYKASSTENGNLNTKFGNGTYGRKPPLGTDNIRGTYRVGGDLDGNVGAGAITGNIDGIQYVAAVSNPMPALGWSVKEAGTDEDLERMKEVGPASIRNQEKATAPSDIPRVAKDEYRTEEGAKVVERAFAVEEAYGPKTVELVVVGPGGEFLTTGELDAIDTYFNGDKYSIPPVEGVLLMNTELTSVNYDPKEVDVTMQVIGKGITVGQIKNALQAWLNPLATKTSGEYQHEFGGKVAVVKLDTAVDNISENITNVIRTLPASDITLGPRQLPVPGTITVTVSETE